MKIYNRIGLGTFLLSLVLLFGCQEEELVVSYIYVPAYDILIDGNPELSSANVSDVLVTVGPTGLGFYPLPARIPILAEGPTNVRIEPTIKRGGVSSNRVVYPHYDVFEEELNLVPGTVDTIRPVVDFRASSTIAIEEDFESGAPSFSLNLDTFATSLQRINTSASTGSGAGLGTLTPESRVIEVASQVLNSTEEQWSQIWLELDYKGDIPIAFAILPENPQSDANRLLRYGQGANAQEEWKKFYFQILEGQGEPFFGEPFRIGILAAVDSTTNAEFFVDNIKVLYRN